MSDPLTPPKPDSPSSAREGIQEEKKEGANAEVLMPRGMPNEQTGNTNDEKCEGCGDPATCYDAEGVPLCTECAESHREKIVTDSLGFRLELTICIGPCATLGRHKTYTDEHGMVSADAWHKIEIKEGLDVLTLALVVAHESYHLFYSVRHLITVDEETEAEVFGDLVRHVHTIYSAGSLTPIT